MEQAQSIPAQASLPSGTGSFVQCTRVRHVDLRWLRPWSLQVTLAVALVAALLIADRTLIVLLDVCFVGFLVVRWIRQPRRMADQGDRLRAYGNRDELEAVRSIPTTTFEPLRVHTSSFNQAWLRVPNALQPIPIVAVCVGAYVLHASGFSLAFFVGFAITVGVLVALAIPRLLPTEFVVRPGRLDILAGSAFAEELNEIASINLRTAAVSCRFHERRLWIMTADGEDIFIYLSGIEDDIDFVQKVFAGAMSDTQDSVGLPLPSQATDDDHGRR